MKKLSYLMLFLLSVIMYGCAETEQPYVGYIVVERAVRSEERRVGKECEPRC